MERRQLYYPAHGPASHWICLIRHARSYAYPMTILKAIPILLAAFLLGNWFLSEARKAKLAGKPWYTPYLTVPGILILIILMIPVYLRFFQ